MSNPSEAVKKLYFSIAFIPAHRVGGIGEALGRNLLSKSYSR